MTRETFTGTVERAEVKTEAPFHRNYYSPSSQDIFVDVALRLGNGETVYFKSPKGTHSIASCPLAAFPVVVIRNGAREWLREDAGANPVATPGKPSTSKVVALVNVGDQITVTGVVKARKVSRKGKPYIAINRVKLEAK